jgi:hypothetical protein
MDLSQLLEVCFSSNVLISSVAGSALASFLLLGRDIGYRYAGISFLGAWLGVICFVFYAAANLTPSEVQVLSVAIGSRAFALFAIIGATVAILLMQTAEEFWG